MSAPGVLLLDTRADVEACVAHLGAAGRHIAPVVWRGQAAWLKLAVAQPPAWRYRLLAAAARALGQPAMQAVRPHGGPLGLRIESRRIRALGDAGLLAPVVFDEADRWLLLSDLGQRTLESLIRQAPPEARLTQWQRGADYLLRTHRAGQYLSQAFARNFVWSDTSGLGAIDFEDDALTTMSLADAQTRDWLSYCFSTGIHFADTLPALQDGLTSALACEMPDVRQGVRHAFARTAWLRALRWLPRAWQRTDVQKARRFGELARRVSLEPG